MYARFCLAGLLLVVFAVDASAAARPYQGRIRFVRGGTSMYRRLLQNNQQQVKQQLQFMEKMAEQEGRRSGGRSERGSAKSRRRVPAPIAKIKHARAGGRGEHERKRGSEAAAASAPSVSGSSKSKPPGTSSPKAATKESKTSTSDTGKPAKN